MNKFSEYLTNLCSLFFHVRFSVIHDEKVMPK